MDPPPTVNANPVVHQVSKELHHKRRALERPELAVISADPFLSQHPEDGTGFVPPASSSTVVKHRSPEDWAVLNALADASVASHGKAVSMLRNLGLVYPIDETQQQEMEQNHRQQTATSFSLSTIPSFSSIVIVPSSPSLPLAPSSSTTKTPVQEEEEEKQDDKRMDRDVVDADEIFDIIRNIQDPEHPLTLEQLGVVSREQIQVIDHRSQIKDAPPYSVVNVRFTPTIPHCSMATQIGLCLKVKLDRSLSQLLFKVNVRIEPGTHASENAINKQLADKERVCAALENTHLLAIVNKCIINGMTGEMS